MCETNVTNQIDKQQAIDVLCKRLFVQVRHA